MELAAAAGDPGQRFALRRCGRRGEHVATTPVGVEVKAVAIFLGMEGKRYRFQVEAFDQGGLVGQGEHTRAIVDRERLERGADDGNERGPGWAFPLSAPAPSLAQAQVAPALRWW